MGAAFGEDGARLGEEVVSRLRQRLDAAGLGPVLGPTCTGKRLLDGRSSNRAKSGSSRVDCG